MQTSNPVLDSTIEGFQPLTLDYDIDGRNNPWGGLGLCTGSQEAFICDTPAERNWYTSIGSQAWSPVGFTTGTIPGAKGGVFGEHAVTRVELYISNFTSSGNNH